MAKPPMKAGFVRKPTTKHLGVFGSICYCNIANERRRKLDDKAEIGIFLDYSSETKSYRIFNLKTKKIMVRRDVIVDEASYRNWETKRITSDDSSTKLSTPQVLLQYEEDEEKDELPNFPVKKTKSLADIYASCNMAVV